MNLFLLKVVERIRLTSSFSVPDFERIWGVKFENPGLVFKP